MKTKTFAVLIGVLLAIVACGPTGPTPPPPGEYGYYRGQNPLVSFHYTAHGVEDFKIESDHCSAGSKSTLGVSRSGVFDLEGGRTKNLDIQGTIQGTTASGSYKLFCGGVLGHDQGTWTAEFTTGP